MLVVIVVCLVVLFVPVIGCLISAKSGREINKIFRQFARRTKCEKNLSRGWYG